MNFSALLFCTFLSSIEAYARLNVNRGFYDRNTRMVDKSPRIRRSPYSYCIDMIEAENLGFELSVKAQEFIMICSHKFNLERKNLNYRMMAFMERNPNKPYVYLS
ncbi:Oidioi.mRNA.OKI2018_I69.chr2.g5102.t1.cds [Oikopleura dioica]|uniref:Oidioi.mRNA.OKI2018_I69.chr2.g5102.t1.cds n=1 Tax=Oikopleura dioica TaxID=34765 RepID=A0ABN7T113_OIKDI|nr:Oidioi.mRNA.OKI2018_I69.chr2.g5102.t1.cds [Oikopleura dioica]